MKIFNYILTAVLAITMIASCETTPGAKNVTLLPSSDSFNAGIDTISFTVQYGEEDVTADAQVFTSDNEELVDKKFSSSIPGNYNFYAIYNDMASVEVTVTALGNLELIADKTTITPDGSDVVTFTVMQDGIDVTSESTLYLIPEDGGEPIAQDGFTFSTTTEGNYNFYATKGSVSSNTVAISAYNPPTSWDFRKRSFIVEITTTGCPPCAYMKAAVKHLEQSGWDDGYAAELHSTGVNGVNDPMYDPTIFNLVGRHVVKAASFGVPYFGWNFSSTVLEGGWTNISLAANQLSLRTDAANEAYACTSGAEVICSESNGELSVTANVAIAEDGNYKVNCYILEDNIRQNQANASAVPDYDVNNHMNVIRTLANTDDAFGDPVTVGANGIESFTWTFESSDLNLINDNLENVHVYVVISKEEGADGYIVNNVVKCALNGSTPYEYAE